MEPARILVACVGNIFLGDDAFGVEVARRFYGRPLPDGVRVVDYGIRGLDLAYALLDGYDATILVDATPRGGEPGTLYVIEPDLAELDASGAELAVVEAHGMDPVRVLRLAMTMGGELARVLVVGCEPTPLDPDTEVMGLSEPVERAADAAVGVVESLVASILEQRRGGAAA